MILVDLQRILGDLQHILGDLQRILEDLGGRKWQLCLRLPLVILAHICVYLAFWSQLLDLVDTIHSALTVALRNITNVSRIMST